MIKPKRVRRSPEQIKADNAKQAEWERLNPDKVKKKRVRRSPAQIKADEAIQEELRRLHPELVKEKGKRRTPEQIAEAQRIKAALKEAPIEQDDPIKQDNPVENEDPVGEVQEDVPMVPEVVVDPNRLYHEQCPDGTPHTFRNIIMQALGHTATRNRTCIACGYSEWSEITHREYQAFLKGAPWPEPFKRPVSI